MCSKDKDNITVDLSAGFECQKVQSNPCAVNTKTRYDKDSMFQKNHCAGQFRFLSGSPMISSVSP